MSRKKNPLKGGWSEKVISENIAIERRNGKLKSQAAAIAYDVARRNYRKRHKRGPFPKHLQRSKNPMARKKKRSAAQRRNDKRLGQMAKKRAAAARKKVARKKAARRKVARKKNPRTSSKKSHLWVVFRCRGNMVHWLGTKSGALTGWKRHKGEAILFKTKKEADKVARVLARKRGNGSFTLGSCSDDTTVAEIRRICNTGK